MEKNLFGRLVESMTQMDEIERNKRPPSRVHHFEVAKDKAIRVRAKVAKSVKQ
ncbi:hypothetical protein PSH58_01675 [Pseudomonas hefeiensis]|uniref:hypothetical protein n=1 Tax=Pseudomonas hefeiensis TaxID=2738125 RepID=UPI0027325342|nr:hypothetical protein [Pseudomonas sp. FP53]WLH96165.1 hypothetical protein PSH58_01675 [Pseudomonas sp. FP53]